MWSVKPSFDLPEGFELKEDRHFLFLFYKGRARRVFNSELATPEVILKECLVIKTCKWEEE